MSEPAAGDVKRFRLPRAVRAPALARDAVGALREQGLLDDKEATTVALLVSELVTNALVHSDAPAGSDIEVVIAIAPARVRVEVADAGTGLAERPAVASGARRGYGLELVHRAVSRWGLDEGGGGLQAWFEIDRMR